MTEYLINDYQFFVWCDEYGDWYYKTPHSANANGYYGGVYGMFKSEDDALVGCLNFTYQYDKNGKIKQFPYIERDRFVDTQIWGKPLDIF